MARRTKLGQPRLRKSEVNSNVDRCWVATSIDTATIATTITLLHTPPIDIVAGATMCPGIKVT